MPGLGRPALGSGALRATYAETREAKQRLEQLSANVALLVQHQTSQMQAQLAASLLPKLLDDPTKLRDLMDVGLDLAQKAKKKKEGEPA